MATRLLTGKWGLSTMTASADVQDGVDLKTLSPGSVIDVETKSRHYLIECLGGNAMRISGHPQYCPAPVLAELQGSIDVAGTVETGCIRTGKHMAFLLDEHVPMTTSKILSVHVDPHDSSQRVH
jgi:hypothetical protein